ncbi:MAG: hypothetical protein PHR82_03960 [Endomicrobiaceae bacterium]|nr:hypothetical protein [Endomicrobiaceae bacterium]
MKKLLGFLLIAFFVLGVSCSSIQTNTQSEAVIKQESAAPQFAPLAIYIENASKDNHFAPSGWMGDYGDIKLNLACMETPKNGRTCIKITYNAKMSQGAGWAGIFWQQPANNWGNKKGGYNLTGAKKLSFWARGANGGEKIAEFKVGGITGEYPDSDSQSMGPIELTKEWTQYTLDLTGKDLSYVVGGFAFSASKDDNPNGFVLYLDDIIFE